MLAWEELAREGPPSRQHGDGRSCTGGGARDAERALRDRLIGARAEGAHEELHAQYGEHDHEGEHDAGDVDDRRDGLDERGDDEAPEKREHSQEKLILPAPEPPAEPVVSESQVQVEVASPAAVAEQRGRGR